MRRVHTAFNRLVIFLLAAVMIVQPLGIRATGANVPLTPQQAVSEMTWGTNFPDLFIADVDYSHGNPIGYHDTAPFGIAIWFWNYGFEWLSYINQYNGTYDIEVSIPTYDPDGSIADWIDGLFQIGIMSNTKDQPVKINFSNTRIVKRDSSEIPLSFMDKTYDITTSTDSGNDGLHHCILNYDTGEIEPSSDLDGAILRTTVTIISVPFISPEAKAAYFYQLHREKVDAEELTDVFLAEGANVFRLPVTWSSFINDKTFEIDECWLKAVQKEVDYILDTGAYCIINMHNDYSKRSFVGTGQTDTSFSNLHWEEYWMYPDYTNYVDARFETVWRQIAEYFKNYSDHLIFEACNEPAMDYHSDSPDDHYITQLRRTNEMNDLFVETIRATGGKNETRLLCLAVANYNQYICLDDLTLPDDDYLMVQIHSYQEMEVNDPNTSYDPNFDYKTRINKLFDAVDTWKNDHPNIPIIIGEVGITHKGNDENQAPRVAYYFQQSEESGIPCLWWEDSFQVSNQYQYWLYNKQEMCWGRPLTLQAIRETVGSPALRVKLSAGDSNYWLDSQYAGSCVVYAAIYDANGKMLDIETGQRAEGQTFVELAFEGIDPPDGCYVKAFLLDENYQPLAAQLQ